jgi:hypothetical protein
MTRSNIRATAAASGLDTIHHVFAAKEAKSKNAMNPEVRINAINKEVRGLFNRGGFSLVRVDAVPSHAYIIGMQIITRLKHFCAIDEEAKSRLKIQGFQDAEMNRIVSHASTVSHASIRILFSSLQSKSILDELEMLRRHSCRARTYSSGICTQIYLLNYVPCLKATS